jgi:hypothetical protein
MLVFCETFWLGVYIDPFEFLSRWNAVVQSNGCPSDLIIMVTRTVKQFGCYQNLDGSVLYKSCVTNLNQYACYGTVCMYKRPGS